MKKILLYVFMMLFLTAGMAAAADDEESWLEIGGDLRIRYDHLIGTVHDYIADVGGGNVIAIPGYKAQNDALFTNRFGLNIYARATEDITVKARLLMYKVWGHETNTPAQGNYFADRAGGPFDGTVGHVPGDNSLRVDQAYATWNNVGGAPIWISAGRRPSTGGVPTNLRQNREKNDREGNPGIIMDYAFDGAVLGYVPKVDQLPGAYAKISYGKGFESGYVSNITTYPSYTYKYDVANTLKDTDYVGFEVVPYSTENIHVDLQVQKGFHIINTTPDASPAANVGDISWWGGVVTGKIADFNLFFSVAQSKSDPNDSLVNGYGLMWDVNHPEAQETKIGTSVYLGGRYDIKSTGTKIGAEYNHGSQCWIGMVPAADDMWTSKLGTRGDVYEVYLIQDLNKKPIMKRGKAFARIGYQYYKFDYTGSNNWMGAPIKIYDLDLNNSANKQILAPVQDAKDLYVTIDVLF